MPKKLTDAHVWLYLCGQALANNGFSDSMTFADSMLVEFKKRYPDATKPEPIIGGFPG